MITLLNFADKRHNLYEIVTIQIYSQVAIAGP